jgi:hypothetical protein
MRCSQVWENPAPWNPGGWKRVQTAVAPSPRYKMGSATTPGGGLAVFGGEGYTKAMDYHSDLWVVGVSGVKIEL